MSHHRGLNLGERPDAHAYGPRLETMIGVGPKATERLSAPQMFEFGRPNDALMGPQERNRYAIENAALANTSEVFADIGNIKTRSAHREEM